MSLHIGLVKNSILLTRAVPKRLEALSDSVYLSLNQRYTEAANLRARGEWLVHSVLYPSGSISFFSHGRNA
jgi:hypothetical protein